jgi:hypothetical protein
MLGLVKFVMVKGCETVTAVAESLMEGLWKLVVNTGAESGAFPDRVVARLVPLSVIVDAAKVPENVVVLPDAVWFAVLVLRLEMAVALVVDAADAEFETVSMAEMRVSRFCPASVAVDEKVTGAWKVDVLRTRSVLELFVPSVEFALAENAPLSLMDVDVSVPVKVGFELLILVARPWSTYAHDAAAVDEFPCVWVGTAIEENVLLPVIV